MQAARQSVTELDGPSERCADGLSCSWFAPASSTYGPIFDGHRDEVAVIGRHYER